jgi:hypothetical protein
MARSLAAVLIVLIAVPAAGAQGIKSANPVKIAYRATAAPIEYALEVRERWSQVAGDAEPDWRQSVLAQQVSLATTANPDGTLSVRGSVLAQQSLFTDGTEEKSPAERNPPRFGWGLKPSGERLDSPGFDDPSAAIAPQFPDEAIAPGHTWEVERKVLPDLELKVKVKHELLGVEVHQGMPCAVVLTETEGKGKDSQKGVATAFRGNGRFAISMTDGALVNSYEFTSFGMKGGANGLFLRRETIRNIERGTAQK